MVWPFSSSAAPAEEKPEEKRGGYECAPYEILETTPEYQVLWNQAPCTGDWSWQPEHQAKHNPQILAPKILKYFKTLISMYFTCTLLSCSCR